MSEGTLLRRTPGRLGAVITRSADTHDGATTSTPDRSAAAPTGFSHHAALDGLRALAVLAIIAFHDDYTWAKGGFLGVDLFFVLSGFLITSLLVTEWNRTGTIALRTFWARRARRLLPALLLVLVGVAALTRFQILPWNRVGVRNDALASLGYVANWRLIAAKQGYFELFSAPSPLRHMLSLAVEEQFYLVRPIVVFVALRLGRRSLKPLVVVCVLATGASVAAMAVAFDRGQSLRAYYGTDTRVHTVLLGALLAIAHLHWRGGRRYRRLLGWTGAPALVIAGVMVAVTTGTSWRYFHGGSVAFALLAAVLVTSAMEPGILRSALGFRPLAWVGRLSYGLYLFHWPIIVWMVPSRFHLAPLTLNLARLGVTFGAAMTAYYLVEMPVRERRLFSLRRRRPRPESLPKRARVPVAAHRDASRWLALPALALTVAVVAASTAGASAPPSYLGPSRPAVASRSVAPPLPRYLDSDRPEVDKSTIYTIGDPGFCLPPRAAESREATRTARHLGPPSVTSSSPRPRILVLGDSTACSLFPGLHAVGRQVGTVVEQGTVFGCGMVTAQPTTVRGDQLTPHASRCPEMVLRAQETSIRYFKPDLIVWMSTWEKADLIIGGRTYVSGTPSGDAAMLREMDTTLARITRRGVKVALVTAAAPAPNEADLNGTQRRVADESAVRLRHIERRFAARHPAQVKLVDLGRRICPHGPPCPVEIGGVVLRPDGRHFTPEAAAIESRWLLPRLLTAYR
ncbi:MAG: acyltransferase family protein [Acidimicrobiales bacterium]